jgi:hypothetical protein
MSGDSLNWQCWQKKDGVLPTCGIDQNKASWLGGHLDPSARKEIAK